MRSGHMETFVVVAPPFFVAVSAVATLMAPGYSSLSDTMSMLMGPGIPHPWIFQLGVVGYALLIQFLGPLLYERVSGWDGALLCALVCIYSLAGILAAVCRNGYYEPVLGQFSENTIHDLVARISFSAVVLLSILTSWVFRNQKRWSVWRYYCLLIGVSVLALVIPFELEVWPDYLGLMQRALFGVTILWVFVTALLVRFESVGSKVNN